MRGEGELTAGEGELTAGEGETCLPLGYRLDKRDPDGWPPASALEGTTKEIIEQTSWEDHEGSGEEEYP